MWVYGDVPLYTHYIGKYWINLIILLYWCVIYACICVNTDSPNDGGNSVGVMIGGIMSLIFISTLITAIIIHYSGEIIITKYLLTANGAT